MAQKMPQSGINRLMNAYAVRKDRSDKKPTMCNWIYLEDNRVSYSTGSKEKRTSDGCADVVQVRNAMRR